LAELPTDHTDLGAYALGALEPPEQARFEEHLAGCAECQAELSEFRGLAVLVERAAPSFRMPADLEAKTLAAVARAAEEDARAAGTAGAAGAVARDEPVEHEPVARREHAAEPRRRRLFTLPRLGFAFAGAAAIAAALFIGTRLGSEEIPGEFELRAALSSPKGGRTLATATISDIGIGRRISFRTDELAILPKGEFYELWFVGPGDTPEDLNRISAGTFHPDEQGRTYVELKAAVDPKKYPTLEVTAEPGDGNPLPSREIVLRTSG